MEIMEKNGNKIKGICLYCLGCNRLEDFSFKGKIKCEGFVPGVREWHDRYLKDLRRGEKR